MEVVLVVHVVSLTAVSVGVVVVEVSVLVM